MLARRKCTGFELWPNAALQASESMVGWVFVSHRGGTFSVDTLDKLQARVRTDLNFSKEFVLHSLRHTMLTRLGESGSDAFTIMRVAGHSTVVVSQRYVHPSPESVERAFERLEVLNVRGSTGPEKRPKLLEVPTLSTTRVGLPRVSPS